MDRYRITTFQDFIPKHDEEFEVVLQIISCLTSNNIRDTWTYILDFLSIELTPNMERLKVDKIHKLITPHATYLKELPYAFTYWERENKSIQGEIGQKIHVP